MRLDPPRFVSAGPVNKNNLFEWEATIVGPTGSPYERQIYKMSITFPSDYPYKPPLFLFKPGNIPSHPNIDAQGKIHWCNLYATWKPNSNIQAGLYILTLNVYYPFQAFILLIWMIFELFGGLYSDLHARNPSPFFLQINDRNICLSHFLTRPGRFFQFFYTDH